MNSFQVMNASVKNLSSDEKTEYQEVYRDYTKPDRVFLACTQYFHGKLTNRVNVLLIKRTLRTRSFLTRDTEIIFLKIRVKCSSDMYSRS